MASKELRISNGVITARINTANGQLFSLMRKEREVMWTGGSPETFLPGKGWPNNSELVMFPIVGPATDNQITIGREQFPLSARHGPSRYMPWELIHQNPNSVKLLQRYAADTEVLSPDGSVTRLPISFELTKRFEIKERYDRFLLELSVLNIGNSIIPFGIGWHPTFVAAKSNENEQASNLSPAEQPISLKQVRESEGNVMLLENTESIIYRADGFKLVLQHNLAHTILWNKGEGYLGIEPISCMPISRIDGGKIDMLQSGAFAHLKPGKTASFEIKISIDM